MPPLELLVIAFTVLIVSLTIHEAAHAWSADMLGDPTASRLGRVSLNPLVHIDVIGTVVFPLIAMISGFPLLGWAKPVPVSPVHLGDHWRRKFMIIAAAGPASNLVLAGLAALAIDAAFALSDNQGFDPLLMQLLFRAMTLNVLLAAFNMLPIPPLDGGNVLAGLLPESGARLLDQMRPFGFLILYGLLFTGVLGGMLFPITTAIEGWLY